MAEPLVSRPFEDANCIAFGHPRPQHLASLVPVNQENKRCAERFKKGIAASSAVSLIAAGDEIEYSVVTEALSALAIKSAPLNGETLEQTGKEFCAREMNIRVCHRYCIRFDRYNDHMRVSLSDIVLDTEPGAGACRGRRKPRVTEFEFAGRFDATHKRFDR